MALFIVDRVGTGFTVRPGDNALQAAASALKSQAWAEGTLPGGAGTKSAKEWSEVAAASSSGIVSFHDLVEDMGTPIAVGEDDRVATWIGADGSVAGQSLTVDQLSTKGFSTVDLTFSTVAFAVMDENERVALALDANGNLIGGSSGGSITARVAPSKSRWSYDINHILISGQSLSRAGGNYASVRDATDYTFSGGIELREEETGNTLVSPPITDGTSAVIWNTAQMAKWLMQGGDTYPSDPYFGDDYKLLISSHGINGAGISTLVKGGSTGAYEDAMFAVDEGKRLATAAGVSYGVNALLWVQGESDWATVQATYLSTFQTMVGNYRADIKGKTGQPNDPVIITYQPSSQQASATAGAPYANRVGAALFDASVADADIIIATPTYWLPHADTLHLTAASYARFGEAMGKVYYKRVFRGEDWRPLEPARITQIGARTLLVQFNVPEGPLVFDTVTVTDPGNYGFVVEDAGGVKAIASVAIVGGDTVRITMAADLGASPFVSYAYYGTGGNGGGPTTGARGNLRDSDPTVSPSGNLLHNWAVAFRLVAPYLKG